ncbi:MAG: DUF721 domain-containing protein [Candidatus Cloacimonetes bacterium]|nr:DUF721 domain-containing protein [Candidatus Cloacimonadota bacterium]
MSSFTSAKKIIENLIRNISKDKFSREIKIGLLWSQAIGKILSQKAFVSKLEKDILFVNVTNNVWLQELVLNKLEILEKINKKLNPKEQIKEIIFSISGR